MADTSWDVAQLNAFIAAVERREAANLDAAHDGKLFDPTWGEHRAILDREVINEWTSAQIALRKVVPDWSARIKTGMFTASEDVQRMKLAQEGVALYERAAEHADHTDDSQPPPVVEDDLHPWVWSAARSLWSSGHYRHAVSDAVEAVTKQVRERTGYTGPSASAYSYAFSETDATTAKPRLHLAPYEPGDTWKNVQRGAARLGEACVAGLRNASVAHGVDSPIDRQLALEQLAAVSLLARWVQTADLVPTTPAGQRPAPTASTRGPG